MQTNPANSVGNSPIAPPEINYDFTQVIQSGKYNTHVDAEHEEDKSIFIPPYDDCEYTVRFVRKSIKEGRRAGILKISFVHQVDNFNNHYTCWRIDIEVDHYCSYFVFQGRRYYQKTFTAWFVYSGFLSIYLGGRGYNKELDEYRTFHGKCPSKFNKYFHFHVTCNMRN